MIFALGVVVGVVLAFGAIAVELYFSRRQQSPLQVIERKIRPQGKVFLPDDEEEDAKKERIQKNEERGRDTPIEELM